MNTVTSTAMLIGVSQRPKKKTWKILCDKVEMLKHRKTDVLGLSENKQREHVNNLTCDKSTLYWSEGTNGREFSRVNLWTKV